MSAPDKAKGWFPRFWSNTFDEFRTVWLVLFALKIGGVTSISWFAICVIWAAPFLAVAALLCLGWAVIALLQGVLWLGGFIARRAA